MDPILRQQTLSGYANLARSKLRFARIPCINAFDHLVLAAEASATASVIGEMLKNVMIDKKSG
jgi:hypothetical protein